MFRRSLAAGFAAVLIAGGLALSAGTAGAAPPSPKCPNPAGRYPPGQCKFTTSRTAARPGSVLHVEGTGFSANCGVTIKLDDETMGGLPTNGRGSFAGKVTIPTDADPGQHTLSANDNCSAFVLGENFTVLPAAVRRGGGLPFTGFVLWPLLGGGAALVAAGSGMIVAGRRRRLSGVPA